MNFFQFCIKVLKECRDVGDMGLVVIFMKMILVVNEGGECDILIVKVNFLINGFFQCYVIMFVCEVVGKFLIINIKGFFGNLLLEMIMEIVFEF